MPVLYRPFLFISRAMAVAGGIVLTTLIVMVCISISGRALNGWLHADAVESALGGVAQWLLDLGIGPVNGDFELVEAGIAFTIFAFLPLCQLTASHASVDIFTNFMPDRVQRVLRMLAEILFAAVLILIAVQLDSGMDSKIRSGQTTFLIQFPIWWAYAACLVGAVLSAIVGVYVALIRIVEFWRARDILPDEMEAEH